MPNLVLLQRDHEASPRLAARIDATGRFQTLGIAHTVAEARELVKFMQPDLVVTDLRLQDGWVHGLLREWRSEQREPRRHVLVTTLSHDDDTLLDALRAGADGYWVHARTLDALVEAMEQLTRGESPMSPLIARQLLSHFTAARPTFDSSTESLDALTLTSREERVLKCLADGYLLDEIAAQSQSTPHALARALRTVYRKLQFESSASSLRLQPM